MCALDNIMLARTIDNLVCIHQFSSKYQKSIIVSKKVVNVIDLRSYFASDSLEIDLELKGPIECLKPSRNHFFDTS